MMEGPSARYGLQHFYEPISERDSEQTQSQMTSHISNNTRNRLHPSRASEQQSYDQSNEIKLNMDELQAMQRLTGTKNISSSRNLTRNGSKNIEQLCKIGYQLDQLGPDIQLRIPPIDEYKQPSDNVSVDLSEPPTNISLPPSIMRLTPKVDEDASDQSEKSQTKEKVPDSEILCREKSSDEEINNADTNKDTAKVELSLDEQPEEEETYQQSNTWPQVTIQDDQIV